MKADINPHTLRILAALLGAPTDESLAALREAVPDVPWLGSAVEQLATLPLDRWQAEHTRLFVSGFPKTVCPPFESAYRHGSMGGETAAQLQALYARIGLMADGVQADYLGVELECAAYLLESGSQQRDDLWQELWHGHLRQWVPAFAADLGAHGTLELYRTLGRELSALFPEVRPR